MSERVRGRVRPYFKELSRVILEAEVTDFSGRRLPLDEAFDNFLAIAHSVHDVGNKIMFIGNGGSASLASHLAIDFSKNGGLRSIAFNDSSALTSLGNDFGYQSIFAKQLEFHARAGDLLVAISSSGRSPSILAAVAAALMRKVGVATFSGFDDNNDLRVMGNLNFYVPAQEYGFVEIAHLSLCHAILDLNMGWGLGAKQSRLAVS
jgi:D-sedoheptulose 7-phosphate isomerase